MCRVFMDFVTGRGLERNSGTQAYSSLQGYQRYSMLLLSFYWRKVGFAALRGQPRDRVHFAAQGASLGRFLTCCRTVRREMPEGPSISCFQTTHGEGRPARSQLPAGSR